MVSGIQNIMFVKGASAPSVLDTQTVTVAQAGSSPDRIRGYGSGLGSITDGTSNIYGGGAISTMQLQESSPGTGDFVLTIASSTNTGWTTMNNTTDATSLTRASASYAGTTWTWASQALAGFFTSTTGSKTITWT